MNLLHYAPYHYGGAKDYGRSLVRLLLVEDYNTLADQTIPNIAILAEDGVPLWAEET